MLGKCHSGEWLAGLTAPVGVALLLVSFLGGTDPASTPYLAPGFGLRSAGVLVVSFLRPRELGCCPVLVPYLVRVA